jgi:hypothetical protein
MRNKSTEPALFRKGESAAYNWSFPVANGVGVGIIPLPSPCWRKAKGCGPRHDQDRCTGVPHDARGVFREERHPELHHPCSQGNGWIEPDDQAPPTAQPFVATNAIGEARS